MGQSMKDRNITSDHLDLHGSDGSSSSSKRTRLSSDVFVDIEQQKRKLGVPPSWREVYRYRIKGAKYQAWIDDPNAPGCNVRPATLTLEEMIDNAQPYPWVIEESNYQFEHLALRGGGVSSIHIARGGKNYHYTYLRRDPGPNSYQVNEYEHHVGRGILVAERIFRSDGPYWCEAARAQYSVDYNIKTLRHVAFVDITDEQTGPYIRYELYPRLGIEWLAAGRQDYYEFEHGSVEYQELLGTRLGVSMACLVLSSFPRGTMKITKIVTWSTATHPQIRFVIQPVIREPVAVATAA
ncbi:hypothetical protein PENCOP_c003G04477 [Penicillium coprophilum]|uniref:Uncharacterized protein n=1 Tax=Penicillium coprophilum TaxID=36646 RepID=A0A1V6UXH0_9EURO|nr:hypothetical protein PENCOP_c003G04477 [Penicillium coprophilum]